ncbi:SCO family protein [Tateyamaria sp.]|uniref:SCO family protein n=1 Tax=Tateyamaria sp. TaxID=1929288 RepID=UPI0032A09735
MRPLIAVVCCAVLPACGQSPFPVNIGGPYTLVDQYGGVRTEVDANGNAQIVFFGYATCLNIRSAALRLMAQVVDVLAEDGIDVTPVMITAAQYQDRANAMGARPADIDPEFVGLTGDQSALQAAYAAFAVEISRCSRTRNMAGSMPMAALCIWWMRRANC